MIKEEKKKEKKKLSIPKRENTTKEDGSKPFTFKFLNCIIGKYSNKIKLAEVRKRKTSTPRKKWCGKQVQDEIRNFVASAKPLIF